MKWLLSQQRSPPPQSSVCRLSKADFLLPAVLYLAYRYKSGVNLTLGEKANKLSVLSMTWPTLNKYCSFTLISVKLLQFKWRVQKTLKYADQIRVCVNTDQCLFLRWQEQAHCRDSRSTLSGGRGGGGAFDYLGRPVLHNNSRRGRERLLDRDEENRLRVETYVRNSTMSLVSASLCMCISGQHKAWFNQKVECISPSLLTSACWPNNDKMNKCVCSVSL